jgi:hypothetical protein
MRGFGFTLGFRREKLKEFVRFALKVFEKVPIRILAEATDRKMARQG